MKNVSLIIITILINIPLFGQSKIGYLTDDGAWCWFSDPRAIVVDTMIFTGWVKSDGTIEGMSIDLNSGNSKTFELFNQLEIDDHDNPAFAVTNSGDIIAMYTKHSKKDMFINRLNYHNEGGLSDAQFIDLTSQEELAKFPKVHVTYANPYRLKKENNRIYCFGRWTGYKPNIMWSDDEGINWSKSRVFITNYPFNKNNRPYVKYYSNGESKIHIVFTDGHPRNEPTNSVYYAYYEDGSFFKANGQQICTIENIPFEPKDASIVYAASEQEGRAWIADIGQDKQGNPIILFTKSPNEKNHEYWYARYFSTGWENKKLCNSGKWFPQTPNGVTERETHYFGGMTLHPDNCNVLYLSRQINGVFEIERWETIDKGDSWSKETITENSNYDNVRPYIPRGLRNESSEIALWMENQEYIHYTDFKTSIKYSIRAK